MAVGCHLLHKWIVLGMDCCVVERIIAVGDAQESSTLLECLWSEFRHVEQLSTRAEIAVCGTVVYDVLRQLCAYTRDVCQQLFGCGVEIDANAVHAAFYGKLKRFFQFCLVYIVLILPYTD